MTDPKEVSDLTKHLVLYAKSHYKESDNVLQDLWMIIAQWSWSDKKLKLERDSILFCLNRMVEECKPPEHFIEDANKSLWRGEYARPWIGLGPNVKDSITFDEYVQSRLSIVRYLSIDQLDWLATMRADETYLPISDNWVKKMKEEEHARPI
jgi:hypothetical protein